MSDKQGKSSAARKAAAKKMAAFRKGKDAPAAGKKRKADDDDKKKKTGKSDDDWTKVKKEDFAVVFRSEGKGGKKRTKVIRRSKDKEGNRVPLKKDKGGLAIVTTAVMKVINKSYMAGEGNVGTGKDYDIHRGNCMYNVGLAVGDVADGPFKEGLEDEQRAFIAKIYEISCYLLGQVFELECDEWTKPRVRAFKDARRELCAELGFKRPMELEEAEENDEELKERVHEHARKLFVAEAKGLPGAKKDGDEERDPVLWATKKVWGWAHYDAKTDSQSTDTGPPIDKLPSTRENWGKITEAMTEMRRKYNYLIYQNGRGGNEIRRPSVSVSKTHVDIETGKSSQVESKIPDPFWNPCLEGKNGKPYESLIKTTLIFQVYRGPMQSDNTYGVKVSLGSTIAIAKRKERKAQIIDMEGEGDVEGYVESEDEEAEHGDAEDEQPAKRARTSEDGEASAAGDDAEASAAAAAESGDEASAVEQDNEDDLDD